MEIVIAGATGFLGEPLTAALLADRHRVTVLSRRAGARVPAGVRVIVWDANTDAPEWVAAVQQADAVINLAGEPIGDHRWTAARKARIEDSRVQATRALVAAIASAQRPPAVLVSGLAVGFYGACGDEFVTEDTGAGHDFLAGVCRRWEAQAVEASSSATRVVCVRTGLVLHPTGGALPRMLTPFRLFVGGRVGSGRQYWPWIHRDDWVSIMRFALMQPLAGPLNATAPEPVTNAVFARELARAIGRPAFFPAPALALRALLGEMATALLLTGQRAVPAKADDAGFVFGYPTLPAALAQLLTASKR